MGLFNKGETSTKNPGSREYKVYNFLSFTPVSVHAHHLSAEVPN